jgi:hypothetical protein
MPEHTNTETEPPENNSNIINDFSSTVIFFDWDDTLCPTSFLKITDITSPNSNYAQYKEELDILANTIMALFEFAFSKGTKTHPVYINIVTNAEYGWVELSVKKLMPRLYDYLILNSINIISAKSTFYLDENDSPHMWKYFAFLSILHSVCNYEEILQKKLNILSIGDSHCERSALQKIGHDFTSCICKSVKLVAMQNIETIVNQLNFIRSYWNLLWNTNKSLDLAIQIDDEKYKRDNTNLISNNINKNSSIAVLA